MRLQFVDPIRARCLRLSWNAGRKVAIHQPEVRLANVVVHRHGRRLRLLAHDSDHRQGEILQAASSDLVPVSVGRQR